MKIPFELAISLGSEQYTDICGIIEYRKKLNQPRLYANPAVKIGDTQRTIELKVENLRGTDAGQEMLYRAAIDQQPARFKELFTYGSMVRDDKFQAMVIYEGSEATEPPTSRFTIISG